MNENWCEGCSPDNCTGCGGINQKEEQMNTEQNVKNVMVVGGMLYDHVDGAKQAWISMIEQVLNSKGYFPEFEEFAKLADELKISQASKKELKTFWWDKYQEMVRGIGGVLSGNKQ